MMGLNIAKEESLHELTGKRNNQQGVSFTIHYDSTSSAAFKYTFILYYVC